MYASDMRVKVASSGLYTSPDVVVVCGTPVFEDREVDTLTNPTVIIEVLSESTEACERGAKTANDRKLDSLAEYLLVSQGYPHVEHFVRQTDNPWLFSKTSDLQGSIELTSINCKLELADIYDKVEFDPDHTAVSRE